MVKGRIIDSDDERDDSKLGYVEKEINLDSEIGSIVVMQDTDSNIKKDKEEVALDRNFLRRDLTTTKVKPRMSQKNVSIKKEKNSISQKRQYVPVSKDNLLNIVPSFSQVKELETQYPYLSVYPHYIQCQYVFLTEIQSYTFFFIYFN